MKTTQFLARRLFQLFACVVMFPAILSITFQSYAATNTPTIIQASSTTNLAPAAPIQTAPGEGAVLIGSSTKLSVQVSDPDNNPLTVKFYVKPLSFTLIHIPDTQRHTQDGIFTENTTWIVKHRIDKNIPFAVQVGDITEGDNASEWQGASAAMAILEDPLTTGLTDGVPYGILAGNHDTLANFDLYFGYNRFAGRGYYGGHYPIESNQNNFELFSAGGMDFIAINLSECPSTPELDWGDSLLKSYSSRRGIVSTHTLFPWVKAPAWHPCGQTIFNALSDNPNLFLMLSGHCRMEARRQDTGAGGQTVYSIAADYTNEMNGNIRLMEFSPGENLIHVRTYSPHTGLFETDANSQFDLPVDMSSAGFAILGSISGVASGSTVEQTLYNLAKGVQYEWYVSVSDGTETTIGNLWHFVVGMPATTATTTATNTATPTYPPTRTPTPTRTATPTASPTATATIQPSPTHIPTRSATPTASPTATATIQPSPTHIPTRSTTPTKTPTPTQPPAHKLYLPVVNKPATTPPAICYLHKH